MRRALLLALLLTLAVSSGSLAQFNTAPCTSGELYWNGSSWGCAVMKVTSNIATASTGLTTIPGLSWTALSNTNYGLSCRILFESDSTNTGLGLAVSAPVSPAAFGFLGIVPNSRASSVQTGLQSNQQTALASSVNAASTVLVAKLDGALQTGSASGTVQVQFRTFSTQGLATVLAGSWCKFF